jgi:hypothetical protein
MPLLMEDAGTILHTSGQPNDPFGIGSALRAIAQFGRACHRLRRGEALCRTTVGPPRARRVLGQPVPLVHRSSPPLDVEHVFDYDGLMTAALDLHPVPGHPGAVAAAVHEALDTVEVATLTPAEYAEVVGEWERAIRRMEATKLALVAAADRTSVAADAGCASTSAWLAKQTRAGGASAARTVRLATAVEEKLPGTAAALADGDVSAEHAGVIAQAVSRLPARLRDDQVAEVERSLVRKARRLDPVQLRRIARRALAAVERDQAVVDAHEDGQFRDEEAIAYARTRLTLHDNHDGTTTGHFTVPTLAASILRKVLDAMTAPRRGRLGQGRDQVGGPRVDRDWAHERGIAFGQLLEHLPTDRLHGKVAATVVVTLDLDTLRDRLKVARIDTGDLLSAAGARRLACQAGLIPAVLGGKSLPLDLGRQQRLYSEHQRVAGAVRHSTCVADGCEVPYAWSELHHRRPWSRGGRTDLDDLFPLCGFHHRRIHDPDYQHRHGPAGVTFHRRT